MVCKAWHMNKSLLTGAELFESQSRQDLKQYELSVRPGLYLIDWVSDIRSQGYMYTALQSLIKGPSSIHHRDIASHTACSRAKVLLGCALH